MSHKKDTRLKWVKRTLYQRCINDVTLFRRHAPSFFFKYILISERIYFVCLIRFFTSHQQSISYMGTGLPGLKYLARINVLAQGHSAVTPLRLEPAALRSRVKNSTTEPLRSPNNKDIDKTVRIHMLICVFLWLHASNLGFHDS